MHVYLPKSAIFEMAVGGCEGALVTTPSNPPSQNSIFQSAVLSRHCFTVELPHPRTQEYADHFAKDKILGVYTFEVIVASIMEKLQ